MIKNSIERIKKPVLIPAALALFLLLATFVVGLFWLQKTNLVKQVEADLAATQELFHDILDGEAALLSSLLGFYEQDHELQQAFLAQDREKLLRLAKPIYQAANTSYNISHFYFILLNKHSFLRVHNPRKFGDSVTHYTLDRSMRVQAKTYGIELGKFGLFTLRVVHPWHVNGELIGYLELGKEIEGITPKLKRILGAELFFSIDKTYLDRDNWERGLEFLGRSGVWNEFEDCVVIDRTLNELPFNTCDFFNLPPGESQYPQFEASLKEHRYRGGILPLVDAENKKVGSMIVMRDFTNEQSSLMAFMLSITLAFLFVGMILFFIFYIYVGRMEQRLIEKFSAMDEVITTGEAKLDHYSGLHVQDAANIRKIEKEYRKVCQRNELILKAAGEGIFGVDLEGRHTFVNPSAAKMLGYQPEELIGKNSHKICHHTKPDGAPYLEEECPIYQAFKDGKSHYGEDDLFWKKDGSSFPVKYTSTPIWEDGKLLGAVVSFSDVTEGKKSQDALQESEELYRAITNTAHDAIILMDGSGCISYWNPAAEKVFGYNQEEALGKDLHLLFAPKKYHDQFTEGLKRFKESGTGAAIGKTLEMTATRKGGQEFPIELSLSALKIKGQWNAVGLIRDISEREQAETEKENLRAQIRRVQKMESIGTLAGGIAHDFNNILGAILGYTELALLEIDEQSPIRTNLDEVRKAGKRAKDLVSHILAFSRQGEKTRQPFEVTPVVKETIKMLRSSLPSTIEIRQHLTAECLKILADPAQFHQVLMNLCTNAADEMRDHGGVLAISMSKEVIGPAEMSNYPNIEPGEYLKLTVSDTGDGMTMAVKERIFDPFFTTKERGHGTGMGLAVVHGIVQSNDGHITVESEPGTGAVFHVLFPLLKSKEHDATERIVASHPQGKGRILLVDDEESLVVMEQRMLEYLGYNVITKSSSIEALEVFNAGPAQFDLVITDLTMPKMTGLELASKMLAVREDLPIILCTGFSELLTEEKIEDIGIQAVIMKPLSINDLATACRTALGEEMS